MTRYLICFFLLLSCFCSDLQSQDTIRIYDFRSGINQFNVSIKNNSEFTLAFKYGDTVRGTLSKEREKYVLKVDTSQHIGKAKRYLQSVTAGIHFIWNPQAKALLLNLALDSANLFHFDTTNLSSSLYGKYITSNGHVGCIIDVESNKLLVFQPFNDVGANEGADSSAWLIQNNKMVLRGKSSIDKWFTDEKSFFMLPYFLVGRKASRTKTSYHETYTYFSKI